MAIESVVWLAGRPRLRETQHGHLLAAQAASRPLDAIEPTGYSRPATHRPGDPRSDPQDLTGQSLLGITPHPKRTPELGIDVAKSTVEKYRVRPRKPPSPTWRAFLTNHTEELVSLDFFTVSTVRFHVLFVLILPTHDRRRVVHFIDFCVNNVIVSIQGGTHDETAWFRRGPGSSATSRLEALG